MTTSPDMPKDVSIAYVSCSKGRCIDVLALDPANGELQRVERVPLPGDGMPLAVSLDGKYLYAAIAGDADAGNGPAYLTFKVDPLTGQLTQIGAVAAPGRMSHITVDRSGRHLLGASVSNSLISSHHVLDDGTLATDATEVRPVPAKAHHISTDHANRFAFVPNLAGDFVSLFKFDPETGRFTENSPASFRLPDGAAPRHIAHHPRRNFAYLLREEDGLISACAVDADTGALTEHQVSSYLPEPFDKKPWGAQILTDPTGTFLFASERNSSTITLHMIDQNTGQLTRASTWATEACPRNFAIDPRGAWLLSAGEKSNCVMLHAIDTGNGGLVCGPTIEVGAGPVWIEILNLP